MASEVISETIMLIVAVTLVGVLAGSVFSVVSSISTNMVSYSMLQSQRLVTDLQIDYVTNSSSTTVIVYLHNIGESIIFNLKNSVLYFGPQGNLQQIGYNSSTLPYWVVNTNTLYPGSVAKIIIYLSSPLSTTQYYTVQLVTPNGYSVSYTFEAS
ncbi:flagellar biosynthesis protein FlaG [Saccharolobus solfataricus]|uniref:Flagellar biosynthesis protein FlaG n=2 Tax=Saccharolobus solfataricus TaxID=2287 RepID=A0A0E3JVR2_SACSO|nr:flagellar protein FlaG [Saccharolobus solfataricus]AKA72574.1 flagellar biosynthesis protein FlaG [Saccharolobus solfataricus]AKA75273.1 flagellar biosynthesis protein FlaG [Saccharolobus solfataricus]AKA77966.1 flagellar biosynthesis protein FlaG [Saccharolobus solfataricus]AZF67084.1 flagellar biosynthesis protein FlaG [Saccharolobus solfataricus]AZF69704.1 flagellar biosynthesis protein FlaG [Saccharolobus solfataricus]